MSALRLYDPTAHQWSIHFATPSNGDLGPPLIGEFHHGRGVFYDQEPIGGRTIWVRLTVYPRSRDEVATEQAFFADQGRTWETNQVSRSTRMAQVDF